MTTRILLVDDRAVVRSELNHVLQMLGDITIVGEASDGWDALRQVAALKPDIVLMDLEMPGLDGFEATRRIKAQRLAQTVIVLTVYGDDFNRQRAIAAGADAFIVKGTDLRTILDLIDQYSHP